MDKKRVKRQKIKVILLALMVLLVLALMWQQKVIELFGLVSLLLYVFWKEAKKTENMIRENAHH